MITGELKNKIDSFWEIFWTGGIYQKSGSSKKPSIPPSADWKAKTFSI